MFQPTWEHPMFIPEHKVVESKNEFWIDEKRIKGVVKDSVKVEEHRERICFAGRAPCYNLGFLA